MKGKATECRCIEVWRDIPKSQYQFLHFMHRTRYEFQIMNRFRSSVLSKNVKLIFICAHAKNFSFLAQASIILKIHAKKIIIFTLFHPFSPVQNIIPSPFFDHIICTVIYWIMQPKSLQNNTWMKFASHLVWKFVRKKWVWKQKNPQVLAISSTTKKFFGS